MKIQGNMEPLGSALGIKKPDTTDKAGFENVFSGALKEVNDLQLNADKAIEDLVTGNTKNIHETMMALGKAELAFKLTMQVRNKVIEAYQEVMRTSV
ncbi:Flagellar hook-basal body complex protein FliE [hydrothermal vent metagenome]|uniref:Flagellar hook-basal body complex protein FliE n=1 Tax=hydrothermal vent metagenome TaxID=652676 RepID=A0A3B1CPA1_9ZZZZ